MLTRIYSDIIIFLVAILFPGWSFFVLGAIASYFFVNFYEFIIVAVLADIIYGFPLPGWHGFRFIFTALAFVVFVITKIFRKKIRFF